MNTGKLIQELRIKAGYTQKTLAEVLHVTDKAISKWERGICLPDTTLLPKIALLLDVDVEILMTNSLEQRDWVGVLDIDGIDFSQTVYDKPLVYYLLSHYLLLGVHSIHVLTNKDNQDFLKDERFRTLGFNFSYNRPERGNYMILTHPWFLFGSDLTQQFLGAMFSSRTIKLVPENQEPVVFFFSGEGYDKKHIRRLAASRTLGRGMVCFDMNDYDCILDVAGFVRTYQRNSGMLIGSLEEIAYRRGLIDEEQLKSMADSVPYGEQLRRMAGKLQVG